MSANDLQAASSWYLEETIATATPARLLCLLYDRLAKDLGQARTALRSDRPKDAEPKLEHAREIIVELLTTLEAGWDGAGDLARIYAWMTSQIITAQVRNDAELLGTVHALVMQLGEAWHQAADALEGTK